MSNPPTAAPQSLSRHPPLWRPCPSTERFREQIARLKNAKGYSPLALEFIDIAVRISERMDNAGSADEWAIRDLAELLAQMIEHVWCGDDDDGSLPYGMTEAIAESQDKPDAWVFIVDTACVDYFWHNGLIAAASTAHGGGLWSPRHFSELAGLRCAIVLTDNDEGDFFIQRMAAGLSPHAAAVKIIKPSEVVR